MAYIVFDMEWNQPMCAAQPQRGRNGVKLSGEIIQIGAVRLTEDGEIDGSFSLCVRPRFYRRLNKRVGELTGITKEQLAAADDFSAVFAQFSAFCGENPTLLSWGFDDTPILRQNLVVWDLPTDICNISYNLQTVFNAQTDGGKGQRSLAFAMEHFGIAQELEAHNALHDAYYTALVAAKLDLAGGIAAYGEGSVSALWEHPLSADNFYPYPNKRAAFADARLSALPCPTCGKMLATAKWVTKGGSYYIATASCPEHGDFIGRIKFSHKGDTAYAAQRGVFRGSKFAAEHYDEVFKASEERKEIFKNRMKEQRRARRKKKTESAVKKEDLPIES